MSKSKSEYQSFKTIIIFARSGFAIKEPYKDKKTGQMRSALMHVVSNTWVADTSITYSKRNKNFTGFIFFTNPDGSFINGWKYEKGKITAKSGKKQKRSNINAKVPPEDEEPELCTTTETAWYKRTCTYTSDGVVSCTEWEYIYSDYTTYCTGGSGGGGGGSGYIEHHDPKPKDKITSDHSIDDNPIVKCIFDNLMNSNLSNGLRNILSAFLGNDYNLNFKLATLDVEGRTHKENNNNWTISINQDLALDPDYSRTYLASTFMHEAFHAKLQQHAIEILGNDEISTWPKPINDMTLNELATYYELSADKKNIWNTVGHDWMVNHINEMAKSIREYIQTYYKETAQNAGNNLETYKSLAYMGLQNSKFYKEEIIDKGKESQLNIDRGLLNALGCGNLITTMEL